MVQKRKSGPHMDYTYSILYVIHAVCRYINLFIIIFTYRLVESFAKWRISSYSYCWSLFIVKTFVTSTHFWWSNFGPPTRLEL